MKILALLFLFLLSFGISATQGEYADDLSLARSLRPIGGDFLPEGSQHDFIVGRMAELQVLSGVMSERISKNESDVVAWYIRGMAHRLLISGHKETDWKELTREEYFSNPEFKRLWASYHADYRQGLALSQTIGGARQAKDVALIISCLDGDVLLAPDVQAALLRFEIQYGAPPARL